MTRFFAVSVPTLVIGFLLGYLVAAPLRGGLIAALQKILGSPAAAAALIAAGVALIVGLVGPLLTFIMTSKQVAVAFELGGKEVRLGCMCKGAGMIQPGMSVNGRRPAATSLHATMLCFLTTALKNNEFARVAPSVYSQFAAHGFPP